MNKDMEKKLVDCLRNISWDILAPEDLKKEIKIISILEARQLIKKYDEENCIPERAELLPYFDAVKDKTNWKNPIEAFIRDEDRDKTARAIVYFTATQATFSRVQGIKGWLKVNADGYYLGPAN